jgi:CheY-like chemotaxis protein
MKVLVIDDSSDHRMSLGLLLRAIGHHVTLAHDGAAGLAIAALFQPEVVFLDFEMPGMTGFEVARALRTLPAPHRMRIVLVTGSVAVTCEEAQEAGCDALMRKPAALSALLAALYSARCSSVSELKATPPCEPGAGATRRL